MSTITPLIPGRFFHIFSRGNNRENLFHANDDYHYFLRLYAHYFLPMADTYAYCLVKNHFHFLVRIREDLSESSYPAGFSKPLSNLFNAYSRTFNRAYGRTGALFQRPFGRIPVEDEAYLHRLIVYIHQNPQKHRFVNDFREWPFSSWHRLFYDQDAFINRENVMKLFPVRRRWKASHQKMIAGVELEALAPEYFQ